MDATTTEDLEEISLLSETDNVLGGLVDGLVDLERVGARIAAWKIEQVDQIRRFTELNTPVTTSHGMRSWSQAATARRIAVSEVALALRIPERSAETLIAEAKILSQSLPLTSAGLSAGDFSYRHAKSIINHAVTLPEALHSEFETRVLPYATRLTVSKFEQKARTTRERMDASTIAQRHATSLADRETRFEPAKDGMGWLHLYTSATAALAAYNRADEGAREMDGPNEERTLAQLRADFMADLLLDGAIPGRGEYGVRPWVAVTVPALSMLGHQRKHGSWSAHEEIELPVLEGYGPIDVDTAKRLAGSAKTWLRVLTHPETGVTLSVGRDRYKVPADLRAWLRLRDGTCRKPGCNRAAARCDLDHTQEWQHGGQTAHDNLSHLCPMHHDEKHHTAVKISHLPNGDIEWTLASGRSYISEPSDRFAR